MPRSWSWSVVLLPLVLGLPPAFAKLEAEEWKTVEAEFARLWLPPPGRPGFEADKGSLVSLLIKDDQSRSYRMLVDALVGECTLWLSAQREVEAKVALIAPVLMKPTKARTQPEEAAMFKAQAELPKLEEDARIERAVLANVVQAIAEGPAALRTNLYARAKGPTDWSFRAAVSQVAAVKPTEKDAAAFLVRTLSPTSEKDPRVRIAAVEALAPLPDGAEDHVIGRLADPDWGVQLKAVQIVQEKKITRAVPHLITALDRASPRMQEALGKALKDLTGENHDAYADVWAKWWEANKEKFQAKEPVKVGGRPRDPVVDPTLYGVPIKSDRVLFVIDISESMRESIKRTAPDPAPPAAPVTPKDGAPPPPPPPPAEEYEQGGPKINVAIDQVRKGIDRLPKGSMFSMIAFNHATLVWKDAPVPATPENKAEAAKWLRQWEWSPGPSYAANERLNGSGSPGPSGSTYVEGALRIALTRIAGLGAIDKAYPEVRIDTIVFLCDGAPTNNAIDATKLAPTEPILQQVREWNARHVVVIHAIAIDMTNERGGNEFMVKLAAENGGTFTAIPRPKPKEEPVPVPVPEKK